MGRLPSREEASKLRNFRMLHHFPDDFSLSSTRVFLPVSTFAFLSSLSLIPWSRSERE